MRSFLIICIRLLWIPQQNPSKIFKGLLDSTTGRRRNNFRKTMMGKIMLEMTKIFYNQIVIYIRTGAMKCLGRTLPVLHNDGLGKVLWVQTCVFWVAPMQVVCTYLSRSLLTYLHLYFCIYAPFINRNISNKLFWSWSWSWIRASCRGLTIFMSEVIHLGLSKMAAIWHTTFSNTVKSLI